MFRLKRAPIIKTSGIHTKDIKPSCPNTLLRSPPDMDPVIWSELPDEILLLIISFLPFQTLVDLTHTSKLLKSLILSPTFISKQPSNSRSSFILLSHPRFYDHFPLYDSDLRRWRRLALPYPDPLTSAAASSWKKPPSSCSVSLLSSSHGLLCFSLSSSSSSSSSSLVVCNVLTRSSRKIGFPFNPFPIELLRLIATPVGYRIFAICSSSNRFLPGATGNHVYVYDSKERSWRGFDGFDLTLDRGFNQEGVLCKGSLNFTKTEPFSLISFDLQTGNWNTTAVNTGLPGDEDIIFARLVSDSEKNKLFLVGGIGRNGISRSIKIWELRGKQDEEEENIWEEIETLPEMICRKFMSVCYYNYEHVYCFWHKETICLCYYNWPEVLYCEIEKRRWHWIQKCPLLPDKWSCGFRWFSFLPNLFAAV